MTSQHFDIKPIAGRIGAKIIGIEWSINLSNEIISDIRKALVKHKFMVMFSRHENL
ncbi:hypothetical protein [Nostoc sp. WHI]|uniref:hypothetical protein n=1 Tax=Nostoc sp. WHI TaxID=2650611 RepID=UPI001E605770|nr:hypothetical protein [Nostoc sp. WHI]